MGAICLGSRVQGDSPPWRVKTANNFAKMEPLMHWDVITLYFIASPVHDTRVCMWGQARGE